MTTATSPEDGTSFWTDRISEAHSPFRYGDKIEIPAPDDVAVARLDESEHWTEDLDVLCGDVAEDMLAAIDEYNDLPNDVVDDLLDHFALWRTPTLGWYGTVERLNVYGPALEYDLWERGREILDYFRGDVTGGWDHLWRLATRLPMGSHYRAAIIDDDVLAQQTLAIEGPLHKRRKGSGRPPLAGFDLTTSYLHRILNKLARLEWAEFASQAGKKRSNPPRDLKGPETADERVDFHDFLREHDEIVSQVLKRKGGTKNVSDQVLGYRGKVQDRERPVPGEAARKGVILPPPPAAIGMDDDEHENGGSDQR